MEIYGHLTRRNLAVLADERGDREALARLTRPAGAGLLPKMRRPRDERITGGTRPKRSPSVATRPGPVLEPPSGPARRTVKAGATGLTRAVGSSRPATPRHSNTIEDDHARIHASINDGSRPSAGRPRVPIASSAPMLSR
jgi:hypothetical protein